MKLRGNTKINYGKKELHKRLGIVLGVVVLVAFVQLINYITRPQIQYSLTEANCSTTAIAVRNKAIGADLKSCVLTISAKNLKDKSVYVDYDGVGGGPAGGGDPLIRIYSSNGKFCFALLAGEGASFSPNATNKLTLRCGGVQKPPKDYDESSDAKPSLIVIAGYSKTEIKVDAVW
jgi:hypothetical protein